MPRAGLTRARVVEEAAAVADEQGWSQLTLASVAARVGVRLPSLYKHIESLDALRLEVAALATRELAEAITGAAVGVSGRDALRAVGTGYRGYATAHPGRYAATVRPPQSAEGAHYRAAESIMAVVLAVLAGYGVTGDAAIDAARALRAALHGYATLEAAGGFGIPRDVDRSFEALLDGLDTMFGGWGEPPTRRQG